MSSAIAASTSTLGWPSVDMVAPTCRLKLAMSKVSKSAM
jgi:hypothetical protein